MAKVISFSNRLKRKFDMYRFLSLLGILISITSFFCWSLPFYSSWRFIRPVQFIFFIGLPSGLFISAFFKNKANVLRSGLEGEDVTRNTLSVLDDSYAVLHNLVISVDGRKSELDFVVVGPSGVFVVETKNLKGIIDPSIEASQWVQTKITSRGEQQTSTFYSPLKQVSTHVYRLSELLKRSGYDIFVQGCVFFSNFATEVLLENAMTKTPIFVAKYGGEKQLREYIKSSSKTKLSSEQIQSIVSLLTSSRVSYNAYPAQSNNPQTPSIPFVQSTEQSKKGFCPHCGNPQKEETPFCPYCGNKL